MWHDFPYFQEKKQGARGDSLVCGACSQVGSVKQFVACALLEIFIMFHALFCLSLAVV
jgi:hypothetical protein